MRKLEGFFDTDNLKNTILVAILFIVLLLVLGLIILYTRQRHTHKYDQNVDGYVSSSNSVSITTRSSPASQALIRKDVFISYSLADEDTFVRPLCT